MQKILDVLHLFYPQMIMGTILGCIIASLGVILVLRKMAFYGVTLSQAVSTSVAISLFFHWKGDIPIIFLSFLLLIPIMLFHKDATGENNTFLGVLFVIYAAVSQFLLSLGGNVQNHLLASYFGDILTSNVKDNYPAFALIAASVFVFFALYKKILFLSFDEDEFRIQKMSRLKVEFVFYVTMVVVLSISINLLGSFYSIAHLLLPAYLGLWFVRSMRALFIFATVFSAISTTSGFFLSLIPWQYQKQEIYFPTSSTVIVFMGVFSLLVMSCILVKRKLLPQTTGARA
ncbi:MAG: metal ABC transporter permease [Spirochaetota bacterium]